MGSFYREPDVGKKVKIRRLSTGKVMEGVITGGVLGVGFHMSPGGVFLKRHHRNPGSYDSWEFVEGPKQMENK